jgi:hypothetical protein
MAKRTEKGPDPSLLPSSAGLDGSRHSAGTGPQVAWSTEPAGRSNGRLSFFALTSSADPVGKNRNHI